MWIIMKTVWIIKNETLIHLIIYSSKAFIPAINGFYFYSGVPLDVMDEYGKTAFDYSTNSSQECKELLQRVCSFFMHGFRGSGADLGYVLSCLGRTRIYLDILITTVSRLKVRHSNTAYFTL